MKHILSVAILCTLVFNFNAQVKLYIQPLVNMKTNQGSFDISQKPFKYLIDNGGHTIQTEYFTFVNDRMFMDFNNIHLGIKLGLNWRKNNFELNFSNDNSSISSGLSGIAVSFDPNVVNGRYYSITKSINSNSYNTLSIDYDRSVWQNKNKTFDLRLSTGLGIMIERGVNKKKGIHKEYTTNQFTLNHLEYNVTNPYYTITFISPNLINPFIKAGVGFDVKTKSQRAIFSFDIFYLHGFKFVQGQYHDIGIDDNGDLKNFRFFTSSKGSGFYFQISRKFQFYPWIPLSKKKRVGKLFR